MGLFPTFSVPNTLVSVKSNVERYQKSIGFDLQTGDFLRDGKGAICFCAGYDAWVFWCVKTLETERFSHRAYSNFIGVEMEQAFREPDRGAQESAIERTVTESLLADPKGRTVRVYDFSFSWGSESVWVSFMVLGKNGDTASLEVNLN